MKHPLVSLRLTDKSITISPLLLPCLWLIGLCLTNPVICLLVNSTPLEISNTFSKEILKEYFEGCQSQRDFHVLLQLLSYSHFDFHRAWNDAQISPQTFHRQRKYLEEFKSILLPITKIQTITSPRIITKLFDYPSIIFPIKGWNPSKISTNVRTPILSFVATKQRHLIETASWCSKVMKHIEDINLLLLLDAWQLFDAQCIRRIAKRFIKMPSVLPTFRKLSYSNLALFRFANLCYESCDWNLQHDFDKGRDELLSDTSLKVWSNCRSDPRELAEALSVLIGLLGTPIRGFGPEVIIAWKFELAISALSREVYGSSEYSSALLELYPPRTVSPYHSGKLLTLLSKRASTTETVKWHQGWYHLPLTYDTLHWPNSYLPLEELLLRWQRKVLHLPPDHEVLREIDRLSHLKLIMTPGKVYTHGNISIRRPHQFLKQTEAFLMISKRILDDGRNLRLSTDGVLLFNCRNPNDDEIVLFFYVRLSLLALQGEGLPILPEYITSMIGSWKNVCFPGVAKKGVFRWIFANFWAVIDDWSLPRRLLTL